MPQVLDRRSGPIFEADSGDAAYGCRHARGRAHSYGRACVARAQHTFKTAQKLANRLGSIDKGIQGEAQRLFTARRYQGRRAWLWRPAFSSRARAKTAPACAPRGKALRPVDRVGLEGRYDLYSGIPPSSGNRRCDETELSKRSNPGVKRIYKEKAPSHSCLAACAAQSARLTSRG
jgi:hypothetical protein